MAQIRQSVSKEEKSVSKEEYWGAGLWADGGFSNFWPALEPARNGFQSGSAIPGGNNQQWHCIVGGAIHNISTKVFWRCDYIALLGEPFTLFNNDETLRKPPSAFLRVTTLWGSTLKLLPAYNVSSHSDYNYDEPRTSNVMEIGLKQFCGKANSFEGGVGRHVLIRLLFWLRYFFGGFNKITVEF